ncbi:MAG: 2-oxoglutarate dehydrogenase E1 component, partial [Burkholderiales bacterium]|nr:2-oxoglutarate dehydrogenase E1 component [Burkholderiales bacterium]
MFRESLETSYLFGANAPFIEELYEKYLENPDAIDPRWRGYFDELQRLDEGGRDVAHFPVQQAFVELAKAKRGGNGQAGLTPPAEQQVARQIAVLQLINAHRFQGCNVARLDPLGRQETPHIPELEPAFYGLGEADMDATFSTGTLVGLPRATLREILAMLRETYCGTIGVEYMYMSDIPQKRWIQQRLESVRSNPSYAAEQKRHILERLTAAETLERYLHARYVGQTRFSLEGGESIIPQLDHLIQRSGAAGQKELVIAMAHRGRLNVLVNTLGKMPKNLFAEFEGKHSEEVLAGDVKYHDGFSSDVMTPGGPVHLSLAFNPSHLEIVNPVVEGSVRARQHRRKDKDGSQVMAITIHGDAAYSGQGVVMETLNLAKTRGFGTGGTFHLIINNQIGFTTSDVRDARSTLYCSDVSKMIEAPIFHVNGDDPEAVLFVTELALDFRNEFHKDVVVDVVCYRRLGHNEQDEPMVTQPLMYKRIHQHPTTRKVYADRLIAEGVIADGEADAMIKTYRNAMDSGYHTNQTVLSNYRPPYEIDWKKYKGTRWNEHDDTYVSLDTLKMLGEKLTQVPANFKLHPRVEKIIADR